MIPENYVYKKEVDWSLLQEGLTLPFDNQVVFGQIVGMDVAVSGTSTYGIGFPFGLKLRHVGVKKRF